MKGKSLDLSRIKVYPIAERRSLTRIEDIHVDPEHEPTPVPEYVAAVIGECAESILAARSQGASVMLIYGAHLLRNGAAAILDRMMGQGWLTHLATNGAGTIHDWEYAWLGASTESVERGVAEGNFGTWDETATNIHRALMAGGAGGDGLRRVAGPVHRGGRGPLCRRWNHSTRRSGPSRAIR